MYIAFEDSGKLRNHSIAISGHYDRIPVNIGEVSEVRIIVKMKTGLSSLLLYSDLKYSKCQIVITN